MMAITMDEMLRRLERLERDVYADKLPAPEPAKRQRWEIDVHFVGYDDQATGWSYTVAQDHPNAANARLAFGPGWVAFASDRAKELAWLLRDSAKLREPEVAKWYREAANMLGGPER